MSKKLTDKQSVFVREYLIDLCATQAAIRAGYSPKTAGQVGFENLKKPEIEKAIQKAFKERAKRTEVTADRVIDELAAIAFANMGDYLSIDEKGNVQLDFTMLQEADLRALSKFTQKHISKLDGSDIIETKFDLSSKVNALRMLGEHLGIFKQKIEYSVDDALAELIREIDGNSRGLPNDRSN